MKAFEHKGAWELAAEFDRISFSAAAAVDKALTETAVRIKQRMREDLQRSRSFRAVAKDVSFTKKVEPNGVEFEIGPVAGRGKGHAGGLAGIAYFGGSRGGGGSVRDPQLILDEEATQVGVDIADALEGLI